MNKTAGMNTPGGNPVTLEKPSSSEAGLMDSGGDQLLHDNLAKLIDPFRRTSRVLRSPTLVIEAKVDKNKSEEDRKNKTSEGNTIIENTIPRENITEVNSRINELENLCKELKNEICILKAENLKLKSQKNSPSKDIENPKMDVETFETDEEDLVRETDWIYKSKKNSKKRKAETSPHISPNVILSKERDTVSLPKGKVDTVKKYKPPPVILSNIKDYSEILKKIKAENINIKVNMMNNDQIKVYVDHEDDYRALTKAINKAKIEWHTYENKETRPIKVMARNLHPSCEPEDIKNELLNRGFKCLDVINKIKKTKENNTKTVIKLPLFMLSFDHAEEINKIYKIEYLQHMRVKIEALRSNKSIPQCKRCQRFGHTQKFCQRQAKCVKCAGNHMTAECKIKDNSQPKCVNCSEAHPASYRGCLVAKEIQKRRIINNKSKYAQLKPNLQKTPKITKSLSYNKVENGVSYSQVLKSKIKEITNKEIPIKNIKKPNQAEGLMQMIQNMMISIDEISMRLNNIESRYINVYQETPKKKIIKNVNK